jgi:hypothetical protein
VEEVGPSGSAPGRRRRDHPPPPGPGQAPVRRHAEPDPGRAEGRRPARPGRRERGQPRRAAPGPPAPRRGLDSRAGRALAAHRGTPGGGGVDCGADRTVPHRSPKPSAVCRLPPDRAARPASSAPCRSRRGCRRSGFMTCALAPPAWRWPPGWICAPCRRCLAIPASCRPPAPTSRSCPNSPSTPPGRSLRSSSKPGAWSPAPAVAAAATPGRPGAGGTPGGHQDVVPRRIPPASPAAHIAAIAPGPADHRRQPRTQAPSRALRPSSPTLEGS